MFQEDNYVTSLVPAGQVKKLSFFSKLNFYITFGRKIFYARKVAKTARSTDEIAAVCDEVVPMCEAVGGFFDIRGLDNLREIPGSCVIAANHQSTLETVLFPSIMRHIKPVTFVVKKSLVTGWLFGPIMRLFNPIALERKEPRVDLNKVMQEGTAALSEGKSVVLFPQGTRCKGFDPLSFNSLAVKLAKRAGVPVVPCAIKTDFWENGKIISTTGDIYPSRPVHIEFGKAIHIDGAGKKEQKLLVDFIDEKYRGWESEI